MELAPEAAEVKAAGGVVWRRDEGELRFSVVHRPKYDDWSLPKGKLDPGESWEQAALREVEEEIGWSCELGEELPPTAYRDPKGRAKAVRYWLMEAREGGRFEPNDEIDQVRWLGAQEALGLLSYERDAALVQLALERLA